MKKVISMILALVLVATMSVAGTVAYLTSKDEVKNTFTVGKLAITLDETDVDVNGVKDGDTRVKANDYKLMPGHKYVKDPIVHVKADSEACYVFLKVDYNLLNNGNILDGRARAAESASESRRKIPECSRSVPVRTVLRAGTERRPARRRPIPDS